MDISKLKGYLGECAKLLNADNIVSEREAEIRAGRFLEAQQQISSGLHLLSKEAFKQNSLQLAKYAHLIGEDTAKNVTEKKANAEAHPEYALIREEHNNLESDISYLKAMLKIYGDAHVFYRQLARGGTNVQF